ncbi:MAG: Smr/MutS family protein [Myxococcales bacterium]|nr:Smr/MutS family protein [Myxococcales bacterium]
MVAVALPLWRGGRYSGVPDEDDDYFEQEEITWKIGDELDLHTFSPKDTKSLVPDYIDECVVRGFPQVRIVHGKGKGVQRRIVHAALERHAAVKSFALAEPGAGGWGATLVVLREAVLREAVLREAVLREEDE